MATRAEIGEALKNADAAGDTEAAKKLADAYAATPDDAQSGKSLFALAPVDSSAIYKSAGELAKNIGGGLASGVGPIAAKFGMAIPNVIRDISQRQMPGTTSAQLAQTAEQPTMGDPNSTAFRIAKAA